MTERSKKILNKTRVWENFVYMAIDFVLYNHFEQLFSDSSFKKKLEEKFNLPERKARKNEFIRIWCSVCTKNVQQE